MKVRNLFTILGLLVAVQAARADTATYATQRRQVRCGIIVSKAMEIVDNGGNNRGPENPDPYIWYVLDSRTDLKPLGLDFVNPLAPPVVTSDIYQRWLQRVRAGFTDPAFDPLRPESRIFRVGARTLKSMGCYWEVNIDALSAEDLKQYDALYLSGHKSGTSFSAEVLEKLRRFVDGGGTLWVENCGRMTFGAPFIADIQFNSGSNSASQAIIATPNHPLMTYPFLITPQEVQNLGDKAVGDYFVYDAQNAGNQVPGHEYLAPIIWNTRGLAPVSVVKPNPGWRALVLAGQIGAGRYIVSCQDSGCTINDYIGGVNAGYGGNSGAVSGENFRNAKPVDMKFAYNLASWTSNNMTALNDVRRSSGTPEKMGATLLEKWTPDTALANLPGSAKVGGAVQYKNLVYSVDGRLTLHCYDAKPEEDLDADGDPDDGIQDFIQGRAYDELWNIRLTQYATGNPTGASAPLVVEFYDPEYINVHGQLTQSLANFNHRELVIVSLSDGTVIAVRAAPRVGTQPGLPMAKFTVLEWVVKGQNAGFTDYWDPLYNSPHLISELNSGTPNADPRYDVPVPTPGWSEGVLFVGVNVMDNGSPAARVMAIDPRNGESAFHTTPTGYGGDAADLTLIPTVQGNTPVISSPTVGAVRDNATGAYDKVVFLGQAPSPTGSTPGSVRAYWFGTKGEPLSKISAQYWKSRARTPWYLFNDAAHPKSQNPLLRQRVFHTYRDPNGAYQSVEFSYLAGGDAVNPAAGQFSAFFINNEMRVKLPAQVNTPAGLINTDDARNTFYADYTVDWGPEVAGSPPVMWRSNYFMPANPQAGISGLISGPPALSTDDLIYYNAAVNSNNQNPGSGVLFAMNDQSAANTLKWTYAMHDGFTINVNGASQVITPRLRQMDPNWLNDPGLSALYGSYVTGVQLIGSPAYRNDVVYVSGRGMVGNTPVTVLAAFKSNPEFVIRLNQRIDPGTPLNIRQLNPVTSPALKNAAGGGPLAENPAYVPLAPSQYTVNYESGLIRITAMAPASSQNALQFTSASLPFLVKIGNNGPDILVAGTKIDTFVGGGRDVRLVGPEGVDNLIWYMVIPANGITGLPKMGYASTGPSVQGDVVWLGFQYGYIASFDADPSLNDPQFQSGGNQAPIFAVSAVNQKGHLRSWRQVSVPKFDGNINATVLPSVLSPPSGTQNLLVANTFAGVHAFEDSFTLIADNKRLIEVNAGGDTVWTSDGTRTFGVAGGDLPIYNYDPGTGDVIIGNGPNATGVGVVHAVAFNRPTVARRTGTNEVLVVDTGNNRVVQIDRGGNVIWEVHRLFDDFKHLLRPGDPLNLNEPTDIKYWQEFNSALSISVSANGQNYTYNGPGYIIHYLISDTGNFRVIELVDVYDLNGNPVVPMNGGNAAPFAMLRQVNYVSSTFGLEGKRYRYRGIQRLTVENSVLPPAWQDATLGKIRFLSLSMITNVRAIGSGQFGVNTTGELAESGGGSIVLLNEKGDLLSMVSNLRIPTNNMGGFRVQRIVNPTFVSMFTQQVGANLTFHFLLADENGVYQLTADPDPAYMDVEWILSADDYYQMTGKKLRASSVRRLTAAAPNGYHHMLIANRFSGEDNPSVFGINYNSSGNPLSGNILSSTAFHGEVFEVDPLTFDWTAPNHGYISDYSAINNFLVPNDGASHFVPGSGNQVTPTSSIVFRSPTETAPIPGARASFITRYVGDFSRATTSSLLEQPAFGDRPF